jgi:hypothetical protein
MLPAASTRPSPSASVLAPLPSSGGAHPGGTSGPRPPSPAVLQAGPPGPCRIHGLGDRAAGGGLWLARGAGSRPPAGEGAAAAAASAPARGEEGPWTEGQACCRGGAPEAPPQLCGCVLATKAMGSVSRAAVPAKRLPPSLQTMTRSLPPPCSCPAASRRRCAASSTPFPPWRCWRRPATPSPPPSSTSCGRRCRTGLRWAPTQRVPANSPHCPSPPARSFSPTHTHTSFPLTTTQHPPACTSIPTHTPTPL